MAIPWILFLPLHCTRKHKVVLTAKEVERESEKHSELTGVRHYIRTGDWFEGKMPYYSCIKNELCIIGQLVMRGKRIVIPRALRNEVLCLALESHQK